MVLAFVLNSQRQSTFDSQNENLFYNKYLHRIEVNKSGNRLFNIIYFQLENNIKKIVKP